MNDDSVPEEWAVPLMDINLVDEQETYCDSCKGEPKHVEGFCVDDKNIENCIKMNDDSVPETWEVPLTDSESYLEDEQETYCDSCKGEPKHVEGFCVDEKNIENCIKMNDDSVPETWEVPLTDSDSYLEQETYCDSCNGEQKTVEEFCVECQEYLCGHCYKYHCVPKITRHHHLLDKKNMPMRQVESDFEELCSKHDGAINKYYCKIHGTAGCISCMDNNHKYCDTVILADAAKDFEDSELVQDFLTWTSQAEKEFEYHINHTRDNIQTSKHSAEKAIADINKYQMKINDKFDQLKQIILKEANDTEQEDVQKISKLHQIAKSACEDLAKVESDIKILQTTKQSKQLFIKMKEAEETRAVLDDQIKKITENNIVRKYAFVENELLEDMLRNIDSIGELLIQNDSEETPVSSYANYPEYGIPQIALLSETISVLADHIHNCLELFEKGKSVLKYPLSSGPWGITNIGETGEEMVAITLPNERTITIMVIDNLEITVRQNILLHARCEGIAYGDNCLFVTCARPAEVLVVGIDGKVRKNLTSTTGFPMFKQPAYIVYEEKTQQLCVTDRQKTTITVIDTHTWKHTEYETNHQALWCAFVHKDKIMVNNVKNSVLYEINLLSNTTTEKNYYEDGNIVKFFYCHKDKFARENYSVAVIGAFL